jgi:putative flippase GtrA
MRSFGHQQQVLRFAISGALVTFSHALIAGAILQFVAASQAVANGIAFVVATIFSYFVNTLWSFSAQPKPRSMLRFGLVSIIGCILAISISSVADYRALPYWYGICWVIVIVAPVTFILHRIWTYK